MQFEDFANRNALRLLDEYRDRFCCFNDDIQGTAAVTLAGVLAAMRESGARLEEQTFLFFGAGSAGLGIGELLVSEMERSSLAEDQARARCWYFDSTGLVVAGRERLSAHKQRFAHAHPGTDDLLAAVQSLRPTALIGVSGQPQTFTQPIVAAISAVSERPLVFALSNPTSKAECTAEQAYRWSNGRAIFASGSPFAPVELDGRTLIPGQGNNAYIFPGVGLGVIASGARRVVDEMFLVAAHALAAQVTAEERARGMIYPKLGRIREVSVQLAAAVAEVAWEQGLATRGRPGDVVEYVREQVYEPVYRSYV